jgi:UDP:flavonoid glycosyltransferase YjiC (YdhE family)
MCSFIRNTPRKAYQNAHSGYSTGMHIAVGVGRHLILDSPDAAEIRDAIVHMTSDSQVRERLNEVRDELQRFGGPAHAADAVENVATGRW